MLTLAITVRLSVNMPWSQKYQIPTVITDKTNNYSNIKCYFQPRISQNVIKIAFYTTDLGEE